MLLPLRRYIIYLLPLVITVCAIYMESQSAYSTSSHERSAVLVHHIGSDEIAIDSSGVDFIVRGMLYCELGFSSCNSTLFAKSVVSSCRGSVGFCDVRSIVVRSSYGHYWTNFAYRVLLNSISTKSDIYKHYRGVLLSMYKGEV